MCDPALPKEEPPLTSGRKHCCRLQKLHALCTGKAKYDAKKHALVWKIKRFDGQWEHTLSASVERLATTRDKKAWGHPPISMSFQV